MSRFDDLEALTRKIRLGEDSLLELKRMRPELLARLFQERTQTRVIRFDEQPVPDTDFADLDERLWSRFLDGVPIILRESRRLSGREPVYRLIDDSELLLTIFSAELPNQPDV